MQKEGKFPWSPRKRMRGPRRADAGAMGEDEKGRDGGMGELLGKKVDVGKDGKDKLVEVKGEKVRVGISRESLLSSGVFHLRHPGG